MNILLFGNVVRDIKIFVDNYPEQNTENRADNIETTIGGNVANTANVLAQLGHNVTWAGALPENTDGHTIENQLQNQNIKTQVHWLPSDTQLPTSYVIISQRTGSRTILHHRNMPEYDAAWFNCELISTPEWVHFESRNIEQQVKICNRLNTLFDTFKISVEVEKNRPGYENILTLADTIIYSHDFVLGCGFDDPKKFLTQKACGKTTFLGWGSKGAAAIDSKGKYVWQDANDIDVVETLGAGDVFNAGIIHNYHLSNLDLILREARLLAEKKCTQTGFEKLA